jgi:regulator of nucleoside diphosphate kinase
MKARDHAGLVIMNYLIVIITIMKKVQKTMLHKDDADVLKKLLEAGTELPGSDAIREKLQHAEIADHADFDYDVARLNSLLLLRDKAERRNFQYRLAVPEAGTTVINTDNVFRPLGAALLGMKKGEELRWNTSKGTRYFFIINVVTPAEAFY